ncbi:MAG: YheT family hydrolase [Isosphaeraceae bacterium]
MTTIPGGMCTINDRHAKAVPPFVPHRWLRGGHAQTIGGRYLGMGGCDIESVAHRIELEDGDRLCVLDSMPRTWSRGDPAALLVHGLAGSAGCPYVVRFAHRLWQMGVRSVRLNLRGAGEGFGLARGITHAGRSEDLRVAMDWLADRSDGSAIALAGFSLGANLAMKLAAEAARRPVSGLDCVLAASPPLDLQLCALALSRPENRIYDWNFVRWLRAQVWRLHQAFPDLGPPGLEGVRTVYQFDDRYTAPRNGFASADDYYARSSAGPLLPRVVLPGLVVHAADDPFILAEAVAKAQFPPSLRLELTPHGGHLGYVSQVPWWGGRRWLETRLAAWLADRWGISTVPFDQTRSRLRRRRANDGGCFRDA